MSNAARTLLLFGARRRREGPSLPADWNWLIWDDLSKSADDPNPLVSPAACSNLGTRTVAADVKSTLSIASGALVFSGAGAGTSANDEAVTWAADVGAFPSGSVYVFDCEIVDDGYGYLRMNDAAHATSGGTFANPFSTNLVWPLDQNVAVGYGSRFAFIVWCFGTYTISGVYFYDTDTFLSRGINFSILNALVSRDDSVSYPHSTFQAAMHVNLTPGFGFKVHRIMAGTPKSGVPAIGSSCVLSEYSCDKNYSFGTRKGGADGWARLRYIGNAAATTIIGARHSGGYYVGVRVIPDTSIELIQVDEGGTTVLATYAGTPPATAEYFDVLLSWIGTEIRACVFGTRLLSARYVGSAILSATTAYHQTVGGDDSVLFSTAGTNGRTLCTMQSHEDGPLAAHSVVPLEGSVLDPGADDYFIGLEIGDRPSVGEIRVRLRETDEDNYLDLLVDTAGDVHVVESVTASESVLCSSTTHPFALLASTYYYLMEVTLSGSSCVVWGDKNDSGVDPFCSTSGISILTTGAVKFLTYGTGGSVVAAWILPEDMSNLASSLGFSLAPSLGGGTTAIESIDLGFEGATLSGEIVLVESSSWHLLLNYTTRGTSPGQLVDVNLSGGTNTVVELEPNGAAQKTLLFDSNEDAVLIGLGEPGNLYSYSPASGVATFVGSIVISRQFQTASWGLERMINGGAGSAFDQAIFGTYGQGAEVMTLDVATGTLASLGKPLGSESTAYCYSYTVAAKAGTGGEWIYAVIAYTDPVWQLAMCDPADGTWTLWHPGDGSAVMTLKQSTGGDLYAVVSGVYYEVVDGTATEVVAPEGKTWFAEYDLKGFDSGASNWETRSGIEVDLSEAGATSVRDVVISHRPTAGEWTAQTIESLYTRAFDLVGIAERGDGKLEIVPATYCPHATYDPDTGGLAYLGNPNRSWYDVAWDDVDRGSGPERLILLSGYASITWLEDGDEAWSASNPSSLLSSRLRHKRCEWLQHGSEAWACAMAEDGRGFYGGHLHAYDVIGLTSLHERDYFDPTYSPTGLCVDETNGKIITTWRDRTGGDGILLVTDVDVWAASDFASATVSGTPVVGATNPGPCAWCPVQGLVAGAIGTTLWFADPSDGTVERTVTLPGPAGGGLDYDNTEVTYSHGLLWLWAGGRLITVDPADDTITVISTTPPGRLWWVGDTCYITTPAGTALRKFDWA